MGCRHNWGLLKLNDGIFFECKICKQRWNAERLVNYLQNELEHYILAGDKK
jgi:hypothetical protein